MLSGNKIMALDLTLAELNPNHRYRLALLGLDSRWLADLSFVRRDESVYLMPLIQREYTIGLADSNGARGEFRVLPDSGFHISLHSSGTVNITFGTQRVRLRSRSESEPRMGPLLAVVVNSLHTLRPAPMEEVNNPIPAGRRVMPLPGVWRDLPVGLTFYRSKVGESWQPQALGDIAQVHLHAPIRGKSVQYHVAVWQNASFIPPPGDVAFYLA